MNTVIVIAMWATPAFFVIFVNFVRIRTQIRRRNHDRILYALCDVRDFMAVKSARGELPENSEMFKYFFGVIADIIHVHRNYPICFRHLALGVKENYRQPVPTWKRRLVREIKKSDTETRGMLSKYLNAVQIAMREDRRIAFIERTWFVLKKTGERTDIFKRISRQAVLSDDVREFARFMSSVRKASALGYEDLALAA